MTQAIRDAAQALLDALDAKLNDVVPYEQVADLRAALSAPQPTADERVADPDNAATTGLLVMQDGEEVYSASGPIDGVFQALAGFARAQYLTTAQQQFVASVEQSARALLGASHGDATMPELPKPYDLQHDDAGTPHVLYTAQQMRTYARTAIASRDDRITTLEADLATAKQRADASQMRMVEAEDDNFHGSKAAVFVNALKDRIAGLEADLREEQDRRQAMRNEWSAEVAALTERINALRSDRDCEKRLRKDAEVARETFAARIAELASERDFAMSQWASAATAYENLSRKTGEEA